MSDVSVEPIDDTTYRVTVSDEGGTTTHEVTVDPGEARRLSGGDAPGLVDASFRFLLEREAKESIMRKFDLSVISRFFPEYQTKIGDYL